MTTIYIAEGMTGLPEFNRPAFFKVEEKFKDLKYKVLNPAILPLGLTHEQYMKICIPMLSICTEIFMLLGYEKSKGAMLELEYAKNNNIRVRYQSFQQSIS